MSGNSKLRGIKKVLSRILVPQTFIPDAKKDPRYDVVIIAAIILGVLDATGKVNSHRGHVGPGSMGMDSPEGYGQPPDENAQGPPCPEARLKTSGVACTGDPSVSMKGSFWEATGSRGIRKITR